MNDGSNQFCAIQSCIFVRIHHFEIVKQQFILTHLVDVTRNIHMLLQVTVNIALIDIDIENSVAHTFSHD